MLERPKLAPVRERIRETLAARARDHRRPRQRQGDARGGDGVRRARGGRGGARGRDRRGGPGLGPFCAAARELRGGPGKAGDRDRDAGRQHRGDRGGHERRPRAAPVLDERAGDRAARAGAAGNPRRQPAERLRRVGPLISRSTSRDSVVSAGLTASPATSSNSPSTGRLVGGDHQGHRDRDHADQGDKPSRRVRHPSARAVAQRADHASDRQQRDQQRPRPPARRGRSRVRGRRPGALR